MVRKMSKGIGGTKTKVAKKSGFTSSSIGTCSGPQKILDYILFLEKSGNPMASRKAVLTMSGIKSNSFIVTISKMKKKGLIGYEKDSIWLEDEGRKKANSSVEFARDNGSVQEELKARLKIGGKAALLFEMLRDGRDHDRQSMVAGLGLKNKASAAVMLSRLKKNGVIEFDRSTIKMTDFCFPFGRPSPPEK